MICIAFLAFWWLFWGGLSTYYVDQSLSSSDSVFVLVLFFVSSMILGAFLAPKSEKMQVFFPDWKLISKVSVCFLAVLFLFQIPVWLFLINSYLEKKSMLEVRGYLYIGDQLSSLEKLVFGFSSAVFYNYLLLCSIVFFHFYKKISFALFFLAYLFISAVLKGSRAELYQLICIFMVYFLTVNASFIFVYFRKYKLPVFSLGSVFLFVMIFVGLERGNDVFDAAVDYHTVGFTLLSKYLGEGGMGHGINYGVSYFGGIDYIVGLLARLAFWGDFQTYSKMALEYQNSMVTTFTAESQIAPTLEMYSLSGYNAFYTLLVSGVESFGSYGVMLLGGAFGFFIKYSDIRAKKGDVFSAFYFVILISAVFMGIFASFLETVGFWLTLILLNIVFIVCRWFDKPI